MDQIYDVIIKYNLTNTEWSEGVYHLLLNHIFYELEKIPKCLLGHIEYYKSFISNDLSCLLYENDISSIYKNLNMEIIHQNDFLFTHERKYTIKNEEEVCYLSDIDYLLGIAFRIENGVVTHVNKQLISFEFILNSKFKSDDWFADENRIFINGWIPICFNTFETPVFIEHFRLFGDLLYNITALTYYFKRSPIPIYQQKIKNYFEKIYT